MIEIVRYTAKQKQVWDEFVEGSINFSILFYRDYIEYHQSRYTDCSLMLYEKNKLRALLPANVTANHFFSHQGLTYGGIVCKKNIDYEKIALYYDEFFFFIKEIGFLDYTVKTIPFFYHSSLCQSQDFYLEGKVGDTKKQDLGAFIYCRNHEFPKSSIERRKLHLDLFTLEDQVPLEEFWPVLENNLKEQHQTAPIHTIEEIKYLQEIFSKNIYVTAVRNRNTNEIDAGAVLFDNGDVLKMQYIATSAKGRKNRAIHALYYLIIDKFKTSKEFIDMGTCMTDDDVNLSLLYLKQRFGASVYCANKYTFDNNLVGLVDGEA